MPQTVQTPARKWLGALLLLFTALLSSCTMVKVAYNQVETLFYWRLDSYADFTREQAPRVHESLAHFHTWHRRTQMPLYADFLQRVRPLLAESITPAQACTVFDQARSLADATLDPANWTMVWIATELSEEQLRHIEKKQDSSDAVWRKQWLINMTPEKLLEERFDQALSRAEMLYGSLDRAQKTALRAGLSASSFNPLRSDAERQRRQQDLLNVLRKIRADKLGSEAARTLLKGYMSRALQPPEPADQRYTQTLVTEACATFSRLHNATTPAQREQASFILDRYARDFRQLASQP